MKSKVDWRVYSVSKDEKPNDVTCFVKFEQFRTREDARDFKRRRVFFEKSYRYLSPSSNEQSKSVITKVEINGSDFKFSIVR